MGIFTGYKQKKSGIFSSKSPSDPMQRVSAEIENKKGVLLKNNIPIPSRQDDDRNIIERGLNTPQKTGFLGDALDVLSRGQYASANIAKSLVDNKEDSFGDVLGAGLRGLKGEDRTSYSDVLGEAGMEEGWGRSTLGFVGDVLLDPTTYLTLGYGAVAKVGGKAAAKGLGKALSKATGKEILDRGGLKFAGLSLVPQSVINKGAKAVGLPNLTEAVMKTKPVQTLGKAFVPNFREADTAKDIWEGYIDLKKGYKNNLDYAQNKAVENAIKLGKELTPKERELVTLGIQKPMLLKGQRKEVINAARTAKKLFNEIGQEEASLGLLKKPRKNYVPGIYPEKGKSLLEGIRYNPSIKATIGKHGKQKKFDTLQDAIDAGLKPETDIAKLTGARDVVSKRATTTQRFVDDVINNYGQKISINDINNLPENMGVYLPKGNLKFFPQGTVPQEVLDIIKGVSDDELIEITAGMFKKGVGVSKKVPVVALPRQIANDLNNFKKATMDEGTKGILKWAYDKPLSLWKAYATATNPGFHIRNASSNMFQTYLNNAGAIINPMNQLRALGVSAVDAPVVGKKIENWTIKAGDKKTSLKEANELMKKEGVINEGWFANEIPEHIEQKLQSGLRKDVPQNLKEVGQKLNLLNPLSTNNLLIKGGRALGGGIENQSRALSFLGDLNRGLDTKQAAKNVDKYLYNYGDLTDFEKNVMRRIFPFYTWMRKNIPLQAEQLVKQPGKYAAVPKVTNAVENQSPEVDESYLPEYMQNWVRTPVEQGDKPVYLNPNLPYGDIDKLNPLEVEKNAFGSLTPFAKAPIELMTNRNFFFESPIERYKGQMVNAPAYLPKLPEFAQDLTGARMIENPETGEEELKMPAKMRYLTKQVPFAENVSRAIEYEDDKLLNHLLSFLAGAKVAPYDIEKEKKNALYDERQTLRDLVDKMIEEGILPEDYNKQTTKKKGIFSR